MFPTNDGHNGELPDSKDASTNSLTVPSPVTIPPTSPISLTMNGYSVACVKLQ